MATNAEAIIQGLRGIHDYEVALSIVGCIDCPYTHNPDCKYDGKNSSLCDDCKIEWLKEEFECYGGQLLNEKPIKKVLANKEIMHSKDLENFLNLFRSSEEQHNIHFENVGKCNNEQQNILHDFENEPSYQERAKLGTKLTKLRYERRVSKDTVELTRDVVQFCKENKAFIGKLERLLGDLRKRENELENRVYRRR